MKVLSAAQLQQADAFTIKHEPVASIDLMERAATACFHWLQEHGVLKKLSIVFCGPGGNGGDGLAIARLLKQAGAQVHVYYTATENCSADFSANFERLQSVGVNPVQLNDVTHIQSTAKEAIIIDALFGFGLARPLQGMASKIIDWINTSGQEVIAIDLPSGLYADKTSKGNAVVRAHYTLTFQTYKLALLMAENALFIGQVQVLPIGLSPLFLETVASPYFIIDKAWAKKAYRPRSRFSHKGTFGHALIAGGSFGKTGAVQFAAEACFKSGAGLVTAYVPGCAHAIMQTVLPEVMLLKDANENCLSHLPPDLSPFTAIGVGPGLGKSKESMGFLKSLLEAAKLPIVIDADALNIISDNPKLKTELFQNSILTPHPKEFERLFGQSSNDFERLEKAKQQASALQCIIVLKGHHTAVVLPDQTVYFNVNGNAGLAKGGSGDVLTGIITSLLAQGYAPETAAILSVYLHGSAADFAAHEISQESMTPQDVITHLSHTYKNLNA